ncbi:MAG: 30S ribosomal protein S12 methylthiotransferase RimO [Eubacterium sp.]|nr:30S ribosomal protein S12 methylthiotransferase RimO [Eubacterium sp.]
MAEQRRKKILFISLGCDKNRVDSERMLGQLSGGSYVITDEEQEADIIIVNTCCFIDEAKEESIQTILEMAAYKKEGSCRILLVAGCMAERYREEIFAEIPEVDAIVGVNSYARIAEALDAAEAGKPVSYLDDFRKHSGKEPPRVLTTGGFFAYLKIAEGCDRHCTYCVIPSLRGPYRSSPMEDLISEAEKLASDGVKELILAAQDTARYGEDLYGKKCLHELLRGLCRIDGLERIRLLYVYPEELYPELIETLSSEPKICRYLDMPIQHSEDRILKRMGRKTTRESLETTVARLRKEVPGIVLRTTLITGFPGETEEEHKALLSFIKEMRFERLGVFTYSREEGTPASKLPDQISEETKERRKEELLLCQQEISLEYGRSLVGKTMEVFIEGYIPADDIWVGRTRADAPDIDGLFFLESSRELHTGDFVTARVTSASEYDLIGKEIEDGIFPQNESAE